MRQVITESVLLAVLGSGLGLFFAQGGTRVILALMRLQENSVSFSVAPDARVLLFTTAAALFSGLLFGIAPALRSSRIELASALDRELTTVAQPRSMHRSAIARPIPLVEPVTMTTRRSAMFILPPPYAL
jgi:hypothetical protein